MKSAMRAFRSWTLGDGVKSIFDLPRSPRLSAPAGPESSTVTNGGQRDSNALHGPRPMSLGPQLYFAVLAAALAPTCPLRQRARAMPAVHADFRGHRRCCPMR